jgi:branched-chain amino acid transport system substrate-binding protein
VCVCRCRAADCQQARSERSAKAVAEGYSSAFSAKWKTDVSTFGGHAYDGLMLAVDAIKRAGGTDKAKVRDAIEATKGFVGTGGVVNMSATDHMGLDLSAFRMLEIKNGDWTQAN